MPSSVARVVCMYICPVHMFTSKHDTLKYGLRLGHLIRTIFSLYCWFAVTCCTNGIGFALLSLVFLRSGMTQSVLTDDAALSMSVPLPAPQTSSSVNLSICTSGLCGMTCAGHERLPISYSLSSCCALSVGTAVGRSPICGWTVQVSSTFNFFFQILFFLLLSACAYHLLICKRLSYRLVDIVFIRVQVQWVLFLSVREVLCFNTSIWIRSLTASILSLHSNMSIALVQLTLES